MSKFTSDKLKEYLKKRIPMLSLCLFYIDYITFSVLLYKEHFSFMLLNSS